MKRATLTSLLRVAGYHSDKRRFTRLYIENRITMLKAQRAYDEGRRAKAAGVRCTCAECGGGAA